VFACRLPANEDDDGFIKAAYLTLIVAAMHKIQRWSSISMMYWHRTKQQSSFY